MEMRRLAGTLVAACLFVGTLFAVSLSSARAAVYSDSKYSDQKVVGLALKYRDGVNPFDYSGNMAALDSANVSLKTGEGVGLGIWTATFDKPVTESVALKVANQLAADSRIEAIYLDHFVSYAKFRETTPKLAVLKASSAPTSVKAADAWSASSASTPRIRLTWRAPSQLNGGVIWGYRIAKYDPLSGSYVNIVSNSKSSATSLLVSLSLTAGEVSKFKVAAVTKSKDSRYMAVSAFSAVASAKATSSPQPPVLQSAGTVTSANPVVTWVLQDSVASGGLPVTYSVTALSSEGYTAACNSTSNSCTLSGLIGGSRYAVRVTATNSRGSAISAPVTVSTDPMMEMQWYLNSKYGLNVNNAWKITKGDPSIVVAVVDSGITDHPDLRDNIVTGYDFISDPLNARDGGGRDANPTDEGDWNTSKREDSSWHGTHVAGIIAAESNDIGIVGIAPNVKISPVRVLGVNGGTESDIAAGINWAIGVPVPKAPVNEYPAKVVNLSIGSSDSYGCGSQSLTQLAIDNSKKLNATIVTAAGNEGTYATRSYPGNCFGNITIGASGYSGDRSYYSNFADYFVDYHMYIGVDISAPGGDDRDAAGVPADGQIWSTLNTGKTAAEDPTYGEEEGTSMASPMAAGVVALMYSVKPNLTTDQVWNILSSTVKSFAPNAECAGKIITTYDADSGRNIKTGLCGLGLIDAGAAVAAVQKLK